MQLLVVIVNYRTAGLVIDCLRSLEPEASRLCDVRVVMVDNASGDASPLRIDAAVREHGWSSWVSVIAMVRNDGYAAGNNAAIRPALELSDLPDYVLILNPDTIVHPGALRTLLAFMAGHPTVGIVGPAILGANGELQCSAHNAPSPWTELDAGAGVGFARRLGLKPVSPPATSEAHICQWVSGSCMLVRRQVFEQAGLFDEGYFLYYDETDFCVGAMRAGWEVWYVPEARITHLEASSTGIRVPGKRRASYWYDSRRRFFVKAYGVGGLLLADGLWAGGRLIYLARRLLGRVGGQDPKWFIWDLLWGDFRALLTGQIGKIRAKTGLRGGVGSNRLHPDDKYLLS